MKAKIICVVFVLLLFLTVYLSHQANNQKLDNPFLVQRLKETKEKTYYRPTPTPQTIKLVFVGDIMLDRHIRLKAKSQGYDFILANLSSLLTSADLVIGNLEGPITNRPSVSINSLVGGPKNYTFTFEPRVVKFLNNYNIRLVNLGNNHILNFGLAGLKSTQNYLDQAGIDFFGYPPAGEPSFLIKDIRGYKIAFVNYNQFAKSGQEQTLADIEKAKIKADFIILYTHWGLEYQPVANQTITRLAHLFIDQGVDLIIGSHPHVIQNIEEYKGKKIYYSLGNFIFDQYFNSQVKKGLIVKVKINTTTTQANYENYYVKLKTNGQTVLTN